MKFIGVIIVVFVLLLFTVGSYAAQSQSGQATASEKIASVFLPVTKWEFTPVVDGKAVIHDFVIQNKGDAPLNISKVKTG
jgi:hypothetical protein